MTRKTLPQLTGGLFLTDGGLETTLIFEDGIDLPHFAAFPLLATPQGRATLVRYYERYIEIARAQGTGFILESPTWRASPDWGAKLGYAPAALASANSDAIKLMRELAARHASARLPMVVSGCVGPRGDGYIAGAAMSIEAATAYHMPQVAAFAAARADMVSAITMTNVPEAVGVIRAARAAGLPVSVSFTVETDGRLPSGAPLGEAIAEADAASDRAAAYYMVNCAHPDHFAALLESGEGWVRRIRGLRCNASRRSHQELNDSPDLDSGDPVELGRQYKAMRAANPQIAVLGGCCGTDHRHVTEIGRACLHAA